MRIKFGNYVLVVEIERYVNLPYRDAKQYVERKMRNIVRKVKREVKKIAKQRHGNMQPTKIDIIKIVRLPEISGILIDAGMVYNNDIRWPGEGSNQYDKPILGLPYAKNFTEKYLFKMFGYE